MAECRRVYANQTVGEHFTRIYISIVITNLKYNHYASVNIWHQSSTLYFAYFTLVCKSSLILYRSLHFQQHKNANMTSQSLAC